MAGLIGGMAARPPNILWIVTTQWRAQALGCSGDPNVRTPCIDALAAAGVRYSQAVTPHPFGPFARAAMFTGVRSPENGIRGYFDPLPDGARTIAHEMGERGYVTAFMGKWHLGERDPAAPPVGEAHARAVVPEERRGGFQLWEGFESGFLLNDPWIHGTRLPVPERFSGYQSDVLCGRMAEWIAERRRGASQPWFAVLSLEPPHPPYDAPPADYMRSDESGIRLSGNVPRGGEAERRARRELAGYYAHIEATDRAVGRLLGDTDSEDSIVLFTSVHGDMHGAHGLFRKGWPHEESVRVPLIVCGPREFGFVPGVTSDDLVSLVDVPSWAVSWAEGARIRPQTPEPRAQTPNPKLPTPNSQLSPDCQLISMPSVVPFPHQCDRVWSGIRTASRKLVLNADGSAWMFFDLQDDPLELRNLAGDPGRARELATYRERWKDLCQRENALSASAADYTDKPARRSRSRSTDVR